jgi:hypothetical protein
MLTLAHFRTNVFTPNDCLQFLEVRATVKPGSPRTALTTDEEHVHPIFTQQPTDAPHGRHMLHTDSQTHLHLHSCAFSCTSSPTHSRCVAQVRVPILAPAHPLTRTVLHRCACQSLHQLTHSLTPCCTGARANPCGFTRALRRCNENRQRECAAKAVV